jgi:hypothetical protein
MVRHGLFACSNPDVRLRSERPPDAAEFGGHTQRRAIRVSPSLRSQPPLFDGVAGNLRTLILQKRGLFHTATLIGMRAAWME